MKHKTKIIFALLIVVVTLCCLLLSGCRCEQHVGVGKCTKCGKDFFKLLKKHCEKNGDFESGGYTIMYSPESSSLENAYFFLSYYPDGDEITMYCQYDDSNIMITMDEIDGSYPYIFGYTRNSGSEYTMKGTLNASLLSGLSTLPYTYSSAPSLLNSSLATLACRTAELLVSCADLYFIENDMPIRCVNLGFEE